VPQVDSVLTIADVSRVTMATNPRGDLKARPPGTNRRARHSSLKRWRMLPWPSLKMTQ